MNISELILTEQYLSFVKELNQYQNPKVNMDADLKKLDILIDIEERCLAWANITCNDILWVIDNYKLEAIRFIVDCYNQFSKPEKEELSQNIEYLEPDLTFPIGHLINLYLIHNNMDFKGYIKKLRVPKEKKYIDDLLKIYHTIMNG